MRAIHPYSVYCGEPMDGAALVFAFTAKQAIRIGRRYVSWMDCDYIDIRARRIRDHVDYLMTLYNREYPCVESPPTCPVCEMWGAPIHKEGCENCTPEYEEDEDAP